MFDPAGFYELLSSNVDGVMDVLAPFNWFVIGYFLLLNTSYIVLVLLSFFHIRRQVRRSSVYKMTGLFSSDLYKPVSILAPAYNEEATIIDSVDALLQIQFPDFEVIVINDGSSDATLERLRKHYELYEVPPPLDMPIDHEPIRQVYRSRMHRELVVVDKENGRKADALNAGLNVADKELACAIDADSILEPDVLMKMLRAFVEDDRTVAVGGIVRVANGCTIRHSVIEEVGMPDTYLARIQALEYLRAFLFGRVGWDYMESLLIISGAFGVFDRSAVLKVGGFLKETVGEDMELVVRLHRHHIENDIPYHIRFLPEPVCWTQVPEDWETLGRQRNRWQRGLFDTLWRHRKMLFNPSYGRLGMLAMPFFLFFELLGPVVELLGFLYFFVVLALGAVNTPFVLLFFCTAILLGMILSVSSVLCEEFTFRRYPGMRDVALLAGYAFLENIGYRQIHTWWRFRGLVDFLKGNMDWGEMVRHRFDDESTEGGADTPAREVTPGWRRRLIPWVYRGVVSVVALLLVLLVVQVLVFEGVLPAYLLPFS
ncbi:MAG: glycosyltransferase [Balneolaceae bacterium]|nr:glycosyltransferase [Balneolaceae bacterium]